MAMVQPRGVAASTMRQAAPTGLISSLCTRSCVRGAVVCKCFAADNEPVKADDKRTEEVDAYYVATARLQQLLTDAALSNKDVVPIDFIDACNVEERLTLFANISTLSIMAAFAVSLIFGELNPLGGMWVDSDTLDAMGQGVLYAVPLLLCSVASRTPLSRPFPVLRDMHEIQHDLLKHFTADMTVPQRCIWLVFVLLPSLLLLLPASKAVLVWAGAFIQQALLQTWGSSVSFGHISLGPLGKVLPPVLSSWLAGVAAASCFNVRPKQIEVVRDALRSADAYFRLARPQAATTQAPVQLPRGARLPPPPTAAPPVMFASSTLADGVSSSIDEEQQEFASSSSSSSSSSNEPSSQAAADAFRMVAMVWLLSRRRVARLAYILTSLDVAYLGVIWQATGNLGAPAAAAFLHAASELWLGEWQARRARTMCLVKATGDRQ